MTRKLKVLISAYACSPYQGSEPGVGWGFVAELSKHHELWVIVEEEKFRKDIDKYLEENPEFSKNVHFHFVRKVRNRRLRVLWPPSYYWYYRRWQKDALAVAESLNREVGFDLVHQLTMVGFREPGYLWKMGLPFVWGPVGGMGYYPYRFLSYLGVYGFFYALGYNFFNWYQLRFSLRPRKAAFVAGKGLLFATPENQQGAFKFWGCAAGCLISEVGVPSVLSAEVRPRRVCEPIKFVWAGLHIPRKALNISLIALSRLPKDVDWELNVLGDGPQNILWRDLAVELGVASRCTFHGWTTRNKTLQIMSECHVMLITSLRDLTSTVTIESLSLGLPIITLDHCGFGGVVDNSCGIKIPVTKPSEVINGFLDAALNLANDEDLRFRLAQGALLRSELFTWPNKVVVINDIYCQKVTQ